MSQPQANFPAPHLLQSNAVASLDEEVARYMVEGFGGVITQLTEAQSEYVGVPVEGPYKPDHYRY